MCGDRQKSISDFGFQMADSKPSTRAIPRIQKIWNLHSAIPLRVRRSKLCLYGPVEATHKLPARKGRLPDGPWFILACLADALLFSICISHSSWPKDILYVDDFILSLLSFVA